MPLTTTPDDAALLRAWLADHDEPALAQLLRRHGSCLRSDARRALGEHSQPQLVEEVLAHLASALASAADLIKRPDAVRAWMRRVVTNHARDLARRLDRQRAWIDEDTPVEAIAILPAEGEALAEAKPLVPAALASLPADQRRILDYAFTGRGTQAELAAHLGVSDRTVRNRYTQALAQLRRWFREHGFEVGLVTLWCLLASRQAEALEPPPAAAPAPLRTPTRQRRSVAPAKPKAAQVWIGAGVAAGASVVALVWWLTARPATAPSPLPPVADAAPAPPAEEPAAAAVEPSSPGRSGTTAGTRPLALPTTDGERLQWGEHFLEFAEVYGPERRPAQGFYQPLPHSLLTTTGTRIAVPTPAQSPDQGRYLDEGERWSGAAWMQPLDSVTDGLGDFHGDAPTAMIVELARGPEPGVRHAIGLLTYTSAGWLWSPLPDFGEDMRVLAMVPAGCAFAHGNAELFDLRGALLVEPGRTRQLSAAFPGLAADLAALPGGPGLGAMAPPYTLSYDGRGSVWAPRAVDGELHLLTWNAAGRRRYDFPPDWNIVPPKQHRQGFMWWWLTRPDGGMRTWLWDGERMLEIAGIITALRPHDGGWVASVVFPDSTITAENPATLRNVHWLDHRGRSQPLTAAIAEDQFADRLIGGSALDADLGFLYRRVDRARPQHRPFWLATPARDADGALRDLSGHPDYRRWPAFREITPSAP